MWRLVHWEQLRVEDQCSSPGDPSSEWSDQSALLANAHASQTLVPTRDAHGLRDFEPGELQLLRRAPWSSRAQSVLC